MHVACLFFLTLWISNHLRSMHDIELLMCIYYVHPTASILDVRTIYLLYYIIAASYVFASLSNGSSHSADFRYQYIDYIRNTYYSQAYLQLVVVHARLGTVTDVIYIWYVQVRTPKYI